MSELRNILNKRNKHERDLHIQFFEEGHKYIILTDLERTYTSVTTWVHSHFPHFNSDEIIAKMMKGVAWKHGHKYWNMSSEQIKKQWSDNATNVSGAGTEMHFEIECFMNCPELPIGYTHAELLNHYLTNLTDIDIQPRKSVEWQYFIRFVEEYPHLKPYRTEWTVYHEDMKLAGSIDMVYENPDGTLSIYDWKRCKNVTPVNTFHKYALNEKICHVPDSNYWHYAIQLNTYKVILEEKYGKKIVELFLVVLHPENTEKNYEIISLPILKKEMNDLIIERKKNYITENA